MTLRRRPCVRQYPYPQPHAVYPHSGGGVAWEAGSGARGRTRVATTEPGARGATGGLRWDMVVRLVALLMALAAEPAWVAGNSSALAGSLSCLLLARGLAFDIKVGGVRIRAKDNETGGGA